MGQGTGSIGSNMRTKKLPRRLDAVIRTQVLDQVHPETTEFRQEHVPKAPRKLLAQYQPQGPLGQVLEIPRVSFDREKEPSTEELTAQQPQHERAENDQPTQVKKTAYKCVSRGARSSHLDV